MGGATRTDSAAFFEPFTLPGFRWTWLTVLAFNTGRYGLVLVGGQQAFRLTHSPMWSSLIMMFLLGPMLVLGPVTGALADRYNRIAIMRIACIIAGAACLVGALLDNVPGAQLSLVVGTSIIVGIGASLLSPAWQAIIPTVLGTRKLLGGGAFTRIAMQGGEFLGPAIGTPILIGLGPTEGFAYCAALYALGAATTLAIPIVDGTSTHEGELSRTVDRIVEGVRYIRDNRRVAGVILLTGCHCTLTMAFLGLLPGLASGRLHSASAYGALVTALGLGAIVGALALAFFSVRSTSAPVLLASGILSGVTLAGLGAASTVPAAIVAAGLSGAAQAVFMAASYTAIQTLTVNRFRGRVASVTSMITAGSMGVLGMAWGAAADATSESLVLVMLGGAFVVVVGVFYATFPALRTRHGLETADSDSYETEHAAGLETNPGVSPAAT